MAKEIVAPETVHRPTGYSHAVRAGDTIYVSGQVALDRNGHLIGKGDVELQAVQVFENLKSVLEAAGASMDDVVKVTTYATHFSFRPKIIDVRNRYFQQPPASTLVIVSSLADPDLLVEVEATAVVDAD